MTATVIGSSPNGFLSAAAMEQLRDAARRERAPAELLALSDTDLLSALGVLNRGRLTRAALLLAGRPDALREQRPEPAARETLTVMEVWPRREAYSPHGTSHHVTG